MKKSDSIIVICIIAVCIALVLLSLGNVPSAGKKPVGTLSSLADTAADTDKEPTKDPLAGESGAGSAPTPTLAPAKCYLLVTIGDVVLEPYPLLAEQDLPITQANGMQNVVHITPDGFSMASATCDNQDCVHQGEVTLENRDVRLLGNQVICLPNQVMLELLTPEEAQVVWNNAYGEDGV